jgi:hypothetical protein
MMMEEIDDQICSFVSMQAYQGYEDEFIQHESLNCNVLSIIDHFFPCGGERLVVERTFSCTVTNLSA